MLKAMVLRNIKLYFKDKGMFFTSLITPAILLVLYATFLGSVYRDSFTANLPDGFSLSQKLIDGAVGAQLISSIFAVSCVTVPFCSNMLMVQDKITGARKDLTISPVSSAVLSGSYFLGAAISSLLVCFAALALCLGYVRTIGWFFSGKDILLLSADIVLLVLFGTALSSLIHFFLSTQGQISAVGTLVSAGYGSLRRIYAHFQLWQRTAKGAVLSAQYLYDSAGAESHHAWRSGADGDRRCSESACGCHPGVAGLYRKICRENGDRPCHVCVYRRRSSGAAGRISCRALSGRKETSPFMKVTIENLPPGEEAEIIIRANTLSQRVMNLLHALQMENEKLMLYHEDGSMSVLHPDSVYYFESVDNKVFAYGKSEVSELKQKLYELEQRFAGTDFIRISKSMILNLAKVERFAPSFSGRFEAILQNGEKVMISRQYVPALKKQLGL